MEKHETTLLPETQKLSDWSVDIVEVLEEIPQNQDSNRAGYHPEIEVRPLTLEEKYPVMTSVMLGRFVTALSAPENSETNKPHKLTIDYKVYIPEELRFVFSDNEWKDWGNCKGKAEYHFTNRGVSTSEARDNCVKCAVQTECLACGVSENFGIWGGTSDSTRRIIRKKLQKGVDFNQILDIVIQEDPEMLKPTVVNTKLKALEP